MAVAAGVLEGGFADAVMEGQAVFRAVLEAMARPGTVQPVAGLQRAPRPLSPVAAALVATVCDGDTPVWLDPSLAPGGSRTRGPGDGGAVAAWIAFHTGAPLAATQGEAQFAICADPALLAPLESFARGTQDYPDRSATLILQVDTFSEGEPLLLEGPGIAGRAGAAPGPLPRHFRDQWRQNGACFPRGVDLIFAGPDAVMCLPRTTRILETQR